MGAGSFGHYRDQNLENIGPAMQQYDWMSLDFGPLATSVVQ